METIRFVCHERGNPDFKFEVAADRTLRPLMYRQSVIGSCLQWQFYNEALGLVLVRRSPREYVAIDDPDRVFISLDKNQPAFETPDASTVCIGKHEPCKTALRATK